MFYSENTSITPTFILLWISKGVRVSVGSAEEFALKTSHLPSKNWVPEIKNPHKHIHECLVLLLALEYFPLCQLHSAQFSGYLQREITQSPGATPTLCGAVEQEWLLFAIPSQSSCLLTQKCVRVAAQTWKSALFQRDCEHGGEDAVKTQRAECKQRDKAAFREKINATNAKGHIFC